jgi:hypothetical protein
MFKIKDVNDVDMAFGGNIKKLLPAYNDIPDEYKGFHSQNKWVEMVNDWFYCGLKNLQLKPKAGVDPDKALRHIKAVMASFEPKHEHKIAGCAYLLSQWFEDVSYERAKPY